MYNKSVYNTINKDFDGLVQSTVLPVTHPVKALSADGQVDPSGQHASPAHWAALPGHATGSPTLQVGPDGDGGDGGEGGDGVGDGAGAVQSYSFDFKQPENAASADGHTEPSGQQLSPAHLEVVPAQTTESPTLHAGGAGGDGGDGGLGGDGVGCGVGLGDGVGVGDGPGPGVGVGLGPEPSGHNVMIYPASLFTVLFAWLSADWQVNVDVSSSYW